MEEIFKINYFTISFRMLYHIKYELQKSKKKKKSKIYKDVNKIRFYNQKKELIDITTCHTISV